MESTRQSAYAKMADVEEHTAESGLARPMTCLVPGVGRLMKIWRGLFSPRYKRYCVKVVTCAAVIFLCRKRCALRKSITDATFVNDEPVDYDSICLAHFAGHTGFGA